MGESSQHPKTTVETLVAEPVGTVAGTIEIPKADEDEVTVTRVTTNLRIDPITTPIGTNHKKTQSILTKEIEEQHLKANRNLEEEHSTANPKFIPTSEAQPIDARPILVSSKVGTLIQLLVFEKRMLQHLHVEVAS
ncbi:hypothetical protein GOBAR_AA09806 [Gossypium barbadense]|uniref:Uncharacterized protein n=1 Tax=Gossypium barbadense TaxID=3634 RepID=A0A2P5Y5J4_GOSBA|nr:hypothetical protein GOBAR_AA09806 [Gossypium barbadense]